MGLPIRRRSFSGLLCAGIAMLSAAACGGGSSLSPTGDSPGTARGATLVGTVETAAVGAASVHALSTSSRGGIRVTVIGLPISTSTDENGRFVLTGLPSGRVEVRFEGPGLDARVEITGLVNGQTLTITFHASGGRVQVVSPGEEAEVEIKGPVESVTPPTLRVQGRTIQTDANTRIRGPREEPITLGQLRVGEVVKVEAVLLSNGTILARRVDVEDEQEAPEDENEVEFTGTIESKGARRASSSQAAP
jgi:Domain of unknown function (DUF5666)/Carboxypeptidase regulatory-like domain